MLRVFLDTNILLDATLERKPWRECADGLIRESDSQRCMKAYIASLSLKDVYYLTAKAKTEPYARCRITSLLQSCEVISISRETCAAALASAEPDFEDAIVAEAARQCKADILITRDEKAFRSLDIPKSNPMLFADFFFRREYTEAAGETWDTAILPTSQTCA